MPFCFQIIRINLHFYSSNLINTLYYNVLQIKKKKYKKLHFFLVNVLLRLKLRSRIINGKLTIVAITNETKTVPKRYSI